MLTEADHFVIETALEHRLINEETAEQLRTVCLNNGTARALDLIRLNRLASADALNSLTEAVANRFGREETLQRPPPAEAPPLITGHEVPRGDVRFGHMQELLDIARQLKASDLHVGVGNPPVVRIHGQLIRFQTPILTAEETWRLIQSILPEDVKQEVEQKWEADFAYQDSHGTRYRACVVKQRLGYDIVFRVINTRVPLFDSLGFPAELKNLTAYTQGLVLVTGPVGSGKSTTMAALLEEVNMHRRDHIITLEDPIEYVFEPKGCQISQREIPTHSSSFAKGLRAALREDPDVIMVGEMRDLETINLAIVAAETGHLVFGTLHTNNAARTVDRVLDVFPAEQQGQIRTTLAESLKGVISQQLIPTADGKGRAAALEILINNNAVGACIRDGKTYLIPGVIQTGKKLGMKLMDDSLMDLLRAGRISGREAYERADVKAPFAPFVGM